VRRRRSHAEDCLAQPQRRKHSTRNVQGQVAAATVCGVLQWFADLAFLSPRDGRSKRTKKSRERRPTGVQGEGRHKPEQASLGGRLLR
jgi:hypothetical protein